MLDQGEWTLPIISIPSNIKIDIRCVDQNSCHGEGINGTQNEAWTTNKLGRYEPCL